jgi:hypothetical protein
MHRRLVAAIDLANVFADFSGAGFERSKQKWPFTDHNGQ